MCGGTLSISDGATVAECEYCGTIQTVPTSNDEVIVNLFNRANNLRLKGDFDKALEVYEKILDLDNTQAEAHWGVVLCKYGVEYVEDPLTKERIPTCHRTQVESILTDTDYQAVLQYADSVSRAVYEEQAVAINRLQKKILEIVKSEKPFDVFICYKETDESGARTKDSVIANEIYHELTNSGLKVFFAAITLENKLGQEYEPYIFAALTSAKVMLVLGTRPEYFNAVWVKNEWSRYLHLMRADPKTKRTLIPCYRDMDAYDLPDEFSHLQALDMANIAFLPDLTRNLSKLLSRNSQRVYDDEEPESDITPLLKRAFLFIEDGEYERADKLLEEVLNQHPENAKAYVGKVLISHNLHTEADLEFAAASLSEDNNFKRACRYADDEYRKVLLSYPQEAAYQHAMQLKTQGKYEWAEKEFRAISSYKDAEQQAAECPELALQAIYDSAVARKNSEMYRVAAKIFATIPEYKDAKEQREECLRLEEEKSRVETEKRYAQKLKEDREQKRLKEEAWKKKKKMFIVGTSVLLVLVAIISATVFIVGYTDDHRLGGKKNPIYLSTPEDLMSIDSFISPSNSGGKYTYYVLKNDIDMTGYLWEPLGDYQHQFYGHIVGGGHSISNLHIDASVLSTSKNSELGFFHTIHGDSHIYHVNFVNVRISGTTGTEKVGVVAYNSHGTIGWCTVSDISFTPVEYMGGIVCFLSSSIVDDIKIQSVVKTCQVSGKFSGTAKYAGGIVGEMMQNSLCSGCSFIGMMSIKPTSGTGGSTGGICGLLGSGRIQLCDVSGTISGDNWVGGICGAVSQNTGKGSTYVVQCTFNGAISGLSRGDAVGGIVGFLYDDTGHVSISSCHTEGSVSSLGVAGSIAGAVYSHTNKNNRITNCSSSSTIYVSKTSLSYGIFGENQNRNLPPNEGEDTISSNSTFNGKIVVR